jgi:DNA polymerase-3 subunit delta'
MKSGSYILVSNINIDKTAIFQLLEVVDCNYYEINNHDKSVKISDVKIIRDKIFLKQDKKYIVFVVHNAHNMTREASNSLLKILEEPPSYAIIILVTQNITQMIPTIMSRCKKINYQNRIEKKIDKRYINILNEVRESSFLYQRFQIAEKISKSEFNIENMLEDWILYLKSKMSCKNIGMIKTIYRFLKIYNKSLNKKLFLENLFMLL